MRGSFARHNDLIAFILVCSLLLCALSGCSDGGEVRPVQSSKPEKKTESTVDEAVKEEPSGNHIYLTLRNSGYDMFNPAKGQDHDYRYGPSMIYDHDAGIIHVWLSSPGDGTNEYDHISYKYSKNYGRTWSKEVLALRPSPGSMDTLSVCDPDVFYYDGYYYMGYTSTVNETNKGLCNSVFLARSKEPAGPYEKWSGDGWGNSPVPVLYYDGVSAGWGVGEPAFVVVDDVLYVYATVDSYTADYIRIRTTQVWTVSLGDENWPADLTHRGCAINRTDTPEDSGYVYADCDSADVVYHEDTGRFIALCTNRRFKEDSCLVYFESEDGLLFNRVSELNADVICGCHNCGLSGDGYGHVMDDTKKFLGYGYSGSNSKEWGVWAARIAPYDIYFTEETDRNQDGWENIKRKMKKSGKRDVPTEDKDAKAASADDTEQRSGYSMIMAKDVYDVSMKGIYAVAIRPLFVTPREIGELNGEALSRRGIGFEVEDESICEIRRDDFVIIPKSPGSTNVRIIDNWGNECSVSVNVIGQ